MSCTRRAVHVLVFQPPSRSILHRDSIFLRSFCSMIYFQATLFVPAHLFHTATSYASTAEYGIRSIMEYTGFNVKYNWITLRIQRFWNFLLDIEFYVRLESKQFQRTLVFFDKWKRSSIGNARIQALPEVRIATEIPSNYSHGLIFSELAIKNNIPCNSL